MRIERLDAPTAQLLCGCEPLTKVAAKILAAGEEEILKAATDKAADDDALTNPADTLQVAEEALLLELFCAIGDCDKERKDRDFMDGSDLMLWAAKRFNLMTDKAKLDAVTDESCEEAVKGAMVYDTNSEGRITYDVFKTAKCGQSFWRLERKRMSR